MKPIFIIILLFFTLIGCSTIPFKEMNCVSIENDQPENIKNEFIKNLPTKFLVLNSIVFKYKFNKMSSLGFTEIDSKNKEFRVVGLNPMGIRLFELHGEKDKVECVFALEEFKKHGDFARAVADDINRIYFDLIPDDNAEIIKEKYKIIFRQQKATGIMEYVFAGNKKVLVEKKYYEKKKCIWKVSYYEYQMKNDKLYPHGIILKNYKYDYELIVYLKEVK